MQNMSIDNLKAEVMSVKMTKYLNKISSTITDLERLTFSSIEGDVLVLIFCWREVNCHCHCVFGGRTVSLTDIVWGCNYDN